MIKLENTFVSGFEAAIRGARNPLNSWHLSDSYYGCQKGYTHKEPKPDITSCTDCLSDFECMSQDSRKFIVGEKDLTLLSKLVKAGTDHSKFMRMINVTVDVTAPLYWWKEADTYKVGTVRNSCSTMHKIQAKEFTLDDFSHEHLDSDSDITYNTPNGHFVCDTSAYQILNETIGALNVYRDKYNETKDKKWWWVLIQLLPSSYNQRATLQLNYAVLRNIYFARRNHKLDEWHTFCEWIEKLPYAKEIITIEKESD